MFSDTEDDSNEYEEVFNPFIERYRSPMKTRRTARKNRDFRVILLAQVVKTL